MGRRSLSGSQPAKNIGLDTPTREVMDEDGHVIVEKMNPIPFNKKMVSPNGNVVCVSLATGFTIRSFKNNDYGRQILEAKLKKGFLPYDECPLATGRVPTKKGDKPCEGTFTREKACPHIEAIKTVRRARHEAKGRDYARRFATDQEKMLELFQKQMELNIATAGKKMPGG